MILTAWTVAAALAATPHPGTKSFLRMEVMPAAITLTWSVDAQHFALIAPHARMDPSPSSSAAASIERYFDAHCRVTVDGRRRHTRFASLRETTVRADRGAPAAPGVEVQLVLPGAAGGRIETAVDLLADHDPDHRLEVEVRQPGVTRTFSIRVGEHFVTDLPSPRGRSRIRLGIGVTGVVAAFALALLWSRRGGRRTG